MNRAELLVIFIKTALLSVLITAVFLLITAIGIIAFGYRQLYLFSQASGTSIAELRQMAVTGWQEPVVQVSDRKNILILGVDSLANRGDVPPLTDTIMIASVNLTNGQVSLISLPRDLWHPTYQTRINALLVYGQDRDPENPTQFAQQALSELTAVPIHHTVVVTLDQVATLIDLIGGVEVEVTTGFIDEKFPRTDVDIKTEHDPEKLYETIEFKPGKEVMTGERALKFIRSRHAEGDAGTDTARAQRQQQVIEAVINQLRQPTVMTNPKLMGKLFAWYYSNFNRHLPLTQGIATAKALIPVRKTFALSRAQIDIYPDQPNGSIIHPPVTKYQGQWVYEVRDLSAFQTEITQKLSL